MKTQKIKRYRLGISRTFPLTHPRKGESTNFIEKIKLALNPELDSFKKTANGLYEYCTDKKIHTIRSNYELWSKRMEEVQAGRAVIELFYWEGKPYKSKQIVFAILNNHSRCGVQELKFECGIGGFINHPFIGGTKPVIFPHVIQLAKNDGLLFDDFKSWFKNYDLSKPMAIIHFTSYRY